jgi:hypothetical protein
MRQILKAIGGFLIDHYVNGAIQTFLISAFIFVGCKAFNFGYSTIDINTDKILETANQVIYYLSIPSEISTIMSICGLVIKYFKSFFQALIDAIKEIFS